MQIDSVGDAGRRASRLVAQSITREHPDPQFTQIEPSLEGATPNGFPGLSGRTHAGSVRLMISSHSSGVRDGGFLIIAGSQRAGHGGGQHGASGDQRRRPEVMGVTAMTRSAVELSHQLTVGGAGGFEVLVPFREFAAKIENLLFQLGGAACERLDVGWGAEAGGLPSRLAQGLGQAPFESGDVGGQSPVAGGEVRDVGQQRLAADLRSGCAPARTAGYGSTTQRPGGIGYTGWPTAPRSWSRSAGNWCGRKPGAFRRLMRRRTRAAAAVGQGGQEQSTPGCHYIRKRRGRPPIRSAGKLSFVQDGVAALDVTGRGVSGVA
ncbi:hypothetical protein [Streptomyces phaeoluteigriseus]